jgi:hypothetical protein
MISVAGSLAARTSRRRYPVLVAAREIERS